MIKRNPGYVLREFAEVFYLYPFGQSVADYDKSSRLNETGVLLWELLEEPKEKEELITAFTEKFEADDETKKEIRKDMERFIAILITQNILLDTEEEEILSGSIEREFEIAGLTMRMKASKECIPKEFDPFEVHLSEKSPNLKIEVVPKVCRFQETGTILVRNEELVVFEQEERFLLLFLLSEKIVEAVLSKDGSKAVVYYTPPADAVFSEDLFHAIRFFFLYMAQERGFFAVHSVSLLYRDRAWLFSGHSGMGKSTHTRLWQENLHTPVFNGDLNLLSIDGESVNVHGIPWCGTSGISGRGTYPLGGIVLLKKVESEIRCLSLSKEEKQIRVANRIISPTWKKELQDKNLAFAKDIIKKVPVWKLEHTKNRKSMDVIQGQMDAYLELSGPDHSGEDGQEKGE